jgi:Uma2 family endonuclease
MLPFTTEETIYNSEEQLINFPTQHDLPCDDDDVMETLRHKYQMDLLLETIYPWLEKRQDGFAAGNMFVYFSPYQVKKYDYKGPDFFCVLDVSQQERKSWVVWEEGKTPDVVIELLSESTANYDKTKKKLVYQDRMRVPEYFWYDPFNPDDWEGFAIIEGVYQPLTRDEKNRYISKKLQLALVCWQGVYRGVDTVWLRWETLDGELLLTDKEVGEQEKQRAEQEKQRAEQEKQRADDAEEEIARLRELLKNAGVDVNGLE